MKTEDALAIIDSFKSERGEAYRLALAASLAVRVEPELVRALRLGVVREADAGAEADLWFSPLVQSQTPLALEFDPAVQELLRRELAEDPELLDGAWEVVESFHAGAPYALRLEEELTWLGLSREENRALIEERLGAALARLRSGREGIARWAARALPTLPLKARTTDAAAVLSLAAGLRTGVGPVLEAVPNRVPEEGLLSEFASGQLSRVPVGVRLLRNEAARAAVEEAGEDVGEELPPAGPYELPMQVELSYPPAPGASVVEVPDTYRLLLEISWESEGGGRRLRQLSLLPDERRRVPVEYGDVTIRTALGDLFVLRPHFEYDFLLLYYPGDERWAKDLTDRLSAQPRDGKPLRVTSAPFDPSFRNDEQLNDLRHKVGLGRKVGLFFTGSHIFADFVKQVELFRPEPPGRGDWLIWLHRSGSLMPSDSSGATVIDFLKQSFDRAFRELWHAVTGELLPLTQEPPTQKQPKPPGSVEIFYAYSYKDEALHDALTTQLEPLRRSGVIALGHDRRVSPGADWAEVFDERLRTSDIILPLVSADFLASEYAYGVELKVAMERHEAGEAFVIPVILKPCEWQATPFGKLQALPRDARPVTAWPDRGEAFADIAKGVARAAEQLLAARRQAEAPQPDEPESSGPAAIRYALIPAPPSFGFVPRAGRDGRDIVERLREELSPQSRRLVALWGAGGVGKTTLAAEAVRVIAAATGQRVVWVSADGRPGFTFPMLLDDIAAQLGRTDLRPLALEPKEEAVRALIAAAPTILVLDTFETIPPEEQPPCLEFLSQRAPCPALITTRQRVEGALLIPLGTMSEGEAGEFLDRLIEQTQDPDIYTEEVRGRILETAEFNPLLVQWVVGQIDLAQFPDEVLSELSQGEGTAAERVFDRSFNLKQMEDGGRTVLLALSLFNPSGTRPMVSEVAGMNLSKDRDKKRFKRAQQTLASLRLIEQTPGGQRLAVAGLTRELAKARLSRDPRAKTFRPRFVSRFVRYAETHEQPTAANLNALETEKDNLLGAMDVAYETGDWPSVSRIMFSVGQFLFIRGYWDESIRRGEQAAAAARRAGDEAGAARLKMNVSQIRSSRGEYHDARRELQEALAVFDKLGSFQDYSAALRQLGGIALEMNELEEARRLYGNALDVSRRLGDQRSAAATSMGLGDVARAQMNLEEAQRFYYESLEMSRKLGEGRVVAESVSRLGMLAEARGDWEEARRRYSEGLGLSRKLGDQYGIAGNLRGLGGVASQLSDPQEARKLFEQSLVIYQELKAQKGVADTLHQMSRLAEGQGDREEAVRLARESLRILERLRSPAVEAVRRTLAKLKGSAS